MEISVGDEVIKLSESMTMRELKDLCKKYSLSTYGKKVDLAARIRSYQKADSSGAEIVLVA